MLNIKPLKDHCWIRFDYEVLELSTDLTGGTCTYDSLVILNSPSGPGGQLCGVKSGFSTVARLPEDKDLQLSVLTQGPSYRWNIKMTQLKCNEISPLPNSSKCGRANGINPNGGFQRSNLLRRILKRKRLRKIRSLSNLPQVAKKKLRNEIFHPSFTARQTFCTPKLKQQQNDNVLTKIINGQETQINQYPWIVSLQLSGDHFCGGTLIAEDWILTAAHCLEFGNVPDFLDRLSISVGDHDLAIDTETKSFIRHAEKIIVHPLWHNVPGSSGDIALIKLEKPVKTQNPICLPPQENIQDYSRQIGTAIGWGITENGQNSDFLREVQLNIIDNITCYETYKSLDVAIRQDFLCTLSGPLGNENICNGDSGSPLMIFKNGKFTEVGLVTFSTSDCTAPLPAVFTRITYYLDWIMAAITP